MIRQHNPVPEERFMSITRTKRIWFAAIARLSVLGLLLSIVPLVAKASGDDCVACGGIAGVLCPTGYQCVLNDPAPCDSVWLAEANAVTRGRFFPMLM